MTGKRLRSFFRSVGELGIFGFCAIQQAFKPPWELSEIVRQIFEAGWRSGPLIIVSGFAFGVVLALETRASMVSFGAQSMIPQAVSYGLFKDMGALITALLVSGRVGAGICVIAMPILTTLLNFSGVAGGMASDLWALHMSWRLDQGKIAGCGTADDLARSNNLLVRELAAGSET